MFFSLSIFGILAPMTFSLIDYLGGRTFSAFTELIYLIMVTIVIMLYIHMRDRRLFHLSFLLTLSFFSLLLITGGEDNGGLVWFTIFPPMVFYVLDKEDAFLWSLAGLLVVSLIILRNSSFEVPLISQLLHHLIPTSVYQHTALLQLLVAYLVVFTLTTIMFTLLDKFLKRYSIERRRFKTLFEKSSSLLLLMRRDGKLISYNQALRGHVEELGLTVESFSRELLTKLGKSPTEGRNQVRENLGVTLNGQRRYYQLSVLELDENSYAIALDDLTELKEKERRIAELKRKEMNVSKYTFLSAFILSFLHDLKNKLNTVVPYVQILADKLEVISEEGNTSRELIHEAYELATELEEKVSQLRDYLLSFSSYTPDPYDMRELRLDILISKLLKEVHADIKRTLQTSNLPPDLVSIRAVMTSSPAILGNESLLGSVILGIIHNSYDAIVQRYQRSGEPYRGVIELSLEDIDLSDYRVESEEQVEGSFEYSRYAYIKISDNGIGTENIAQYFELGKTTKAFSSRGYGGMGIGLTTTLLIITGHKGKMWAESKPGVGTTFHIYLPLAEELSSELSQE